jgi:hypothetical protein
MLLKRATPLKIIKEQNARNKNKKALAFKN